MIRKTQTMDNVNIGLVRGKMINKTTGKWIKSPQRSFINHRVMMFESASLASDCFEGLITQIPSTTDSKNVAIQYRSKKQKDIHIYSNSFDCDELTDIFNAFGFDAEPLWNSDDNNAYWAEQGDILKEEMDEIDEEEEDSQSIDEVEAQKRLNFMNSL